MTTIVTPSVKLVHATPDSEALIEMAGRVCYRSVPKDPVNSAGNFIKMLKRRHHMSVLEHASAGFIIQTDRAIGNEIVRHRVASYSQESTRYVCYLKDQFDSQISVLVPHDILPNTPSYDIWWAGVCFAEQTYLGLTKAGQTPEMARSVLPLCTATTLVWTANFREWLHIAALRDDLAAHPDMRVIMQMIKAELAKIAPHVFDWAE